MAKSFLARGVLFLFLLVPALASGALLDDYYLSKFGLARQTLKGLSAAAGEEAPLERCRTHLYRSVKRDWALLEPATQSALAKQVWARPELAGAAFHTSPAGHFTIHYATAGQDAPNLTDADADQVPDWVERVAQVFDEVRAIEVAVDGLGYRPPPVQRYDVYLKDLAASRTYGLTDADAPAGSAVSAPSYIQIDKAFTDPNLNPLGRYSAEELLQITAAHEFHHAIQFGYNFYFDFWYAEVTATWIEDEVYELVNQLYDYLPSYLPNAGNITLDAPVDGASEYGRWIFNRYLAERHGRELIRDVWVRLAAIPAPADRNSEIPMIPVIDAALKARGSTLAGDFTGFAKKIYLRDWTSHIADTGLIPVVVPQATFSSYPLSTAQSSGISSTVSTLPRYAFASYKFLPGASAPADLTLTIPGVPSGIDLVALKTSTTGTVQEFALERATGTITVPSFNAADTAEVQLVISNSARESAVVPPPAPSSGGGGGGGGCFIATAAYGSYLHPKVAELRSFRDRYLLTNAPGRLFVALYYRVSPPLARVIAEHDLLRAAARGLLVPLVLALEYPVPALLLMLLSGGGVGWRLTRRRQAARFA